MPGNQDEQDQRAIRAKIAEQQAQQAAALQAQQEAAQAQLTHQQAQLTEQQAQQAAALQAQQEAAQLAQQQALEQQAASQQAQQPAQQPELHLLPDPLHDAQQKQVGGHRMLRNQLENQRHQKIGCHICLPRHLTEMSNIINYHLH